MEDLARRLAEVINKAGPGHRQDVREYAIDLLREGTEAVGQVSPRPGSAPRTGTNPLGMAILLGVIGLPMFVLFAPMGIALLGTAFVLGTWGVLSVVLRRSSKGDSR